MWNVKQKKAKKIGLKLLCGTEEMRKMECQEVKKPADREHVEGMVNKGLGMTCETSKEGGEGIENVCRLFIEIQNA